MAQSTEIKRLLRKADIRAASVAEHLAVAQSTLSLKLSGQRPFRIEELAAIRDLLNVPERLKRLGRRKPLTLDDLVGAGTGKAAA